MKSNIVCFTDYCDLPKNLKILSKNREKTEIPESEVKLSNTNECDTNLNDKDDSFNLCDYFV